jgi:carbohydrate kinase (thermoresistant glucokinase family)
MQSAAASANRRIVVMGVAGSGKTTIGKALAEVVGAPFVDADSLHSPANVAKMAAGHPLTDADRWPWLARVRQELRGTSDVVIACSALTRRYRDLLRHAGDVRFVYLALDRATASDRALHREGHFMHADMVASQFDTLEPPETDETDIVVVDGTLHIDEVVAGAVRGLETAPASTSATPLIADGGIARAITADELADHVATLVGDHVLAFGARRVLLVPPDHTRLHSRSGPITVLLQRELETHGCVVGVLPALGTHVSMTDEDATAMFGDSLRAVDLLLHDWRNGLKVLGEIGGDEVGVVTAGRYVEPIPVAVDAQLFDGWDLVISIGQVVPHEVIGMANFTKNVVIGLGGAPTIHRSHFVGAVAGMEQIMGRTTSAVRDVVDAAYDRFVDPLVRVLWVLTVVEDVGGSMLQRGLFVGAGGTMQSGGAAFRSAAALARQTNIDIVDEPLDRVVCWLDPAEMRSTWLGNKAIYRTRMAIADGGELVVLGPGVARFGEDPEIDVLIRRHGYRGTATTLDAVRDDPELAANLGAAAHLVHGSSEGRFRIVWCTDPTTGLTRADVESVGYEWRDLRDELAHLGVGASTTSGPRTDRAGVAFEFIANPAMGLWSTADRLV